MGPYVGVNAVLIGLFGFAAGVPFLAGLIPPGLPARCTI